MSTRPVTSVTADMLTPCAPALLGALTARFNQHHALSVRPDGSPCPCEHCSDVRWALYEHGKRHGDVFNRPPRPVESTFPPQFEKRIEVRDGVLHHVFVPPSRAMHERAYSPEHARTCTAPLVQAAVSHATSGPHRLIDCPDYRAAKSSAYVKAVSADYNPHGDWCYDREGDKRCDHFAPSGRFGGPMIGGVRPAYAHPDVEGFELWLHENAPRVTPIWNEDGIHDGMPGE